MATMTDLDNEVATFGCHPDDSMNSSRRTFGFDAAENLVSRGSGSTLAYDAARQLTTLTPATGPETRFQYNQLGDRISATTGSDVDRFAYNQTAALTRITPSSGASTSYGYDGLGLRQWKLRGSDRQQMTWTVGDLPLLLSDDENTFIYGPDGRPMEQVGSDGDVRYLMSDALGSIRAVTNDDGAVIGTASYDPWGTPNTTGNTAALGYAGEYTDAESGLVYLRARYYDPATAQFLTRDPIEDLTGDPYGYGDGNPVMNTDPTGLWPSLQDTSDFFAGAGDTLTFGGTNWVREQIGSNDVVDKCSGWYTGGQATGAGLSLATGGAGVGLVRLRFAYQAEARALAVTSRNGREAVLARNALKERYRAKTPWAINRWAERRNLAKYGNKVGPSYYQLFNQYGTDREVIAAAGRTAGFFG